MTSSRGTEPLLLDAHYSRRIAAALRGLGHDVLACGDIEHEPPLVTLADADLLDFAATAGRRLVTENVRDLRPLNNERLAAGAWSRILCIPASRHRRTRDDEPALVAAVDEWLRAGAETDNPEAWLL